MQVAEEYVTQLFDLTLHIIDQIGDIGYEDLAAFADQRESLVKTMMSNHTEFNESDKIKIKQLMDYDHIIINKMLSLKNEASNWLNKQGSIRVQKNAYSAHYAPDSLFFDTKN